MTTLHKLILYILSLIILSSPLTALSRQLPFHKNSLKDIEEQYKGKPFLLVLWSIDCPPCRDELQLLGQLKHQQKKLNLVLISTDNISQQNKLNKILDEYKLTGIESWAFATNNNYQLRYAIDPQWFGEMPRSYFYNTEHKRTGISGKLKYNTIMKWLTRQ